MRRRVRRQTMKSVLKYIKHFKTVAVRLRLISQLSYVQDCIWCQLGQSQPTEGRKELAVTRHCACQRPDILLNMSIYRKHLQSCALSNWKYFRFRCGCTPVPVSFSWNFVVISPYFAIFNNAVHSLEPGETPSYSESHPAPNYAQHS